MGGKLPFPLRNRLKSPHAIRRILRDPHTRCRKWEGFRVACADSVPSKRGGKPGPTPQFAFVASGRIGPAVLRNRIKRRLREAVRLNREFWPTGKAVIITADGDLVAHVDFVVLLGRIREALAWATAKNTGT